VMKFATNVAHGGVEFDSERTFLAIGYRDISKSIRGEI
jgi:hypothetical protein